MTAMTTARNLLGSIRELASKRREAAIVSYTQLVESLASGQAIDPERVLDLLTAAGKTDEQLQEDVDLILRRQKAAEDLAARDAAIVLAEEIRQKIQAVERKKEKAIAPFDRELEQLSASMPDFLMLNAVAMDAQKLLLETAPPQIDVRLSELGKRRGVVEQRIAALSEIVGNNDGVRDSLAAKDEQHGSGRRASTIADFDATLERQRRELSQAITEQAEIAREYKSLEAARLKP